jgi:hypothetical protein
MTEQITIQGAIELGLMILAIVGIPSVILVAIYFLTREKK